MLFIENFTITGIANDEVRNTPKTGSATGKEKILKLWFQETTAVENRDSIVKVYKNNVAVVQMPAAILNDAHDLDTAPAPRAIDLDIELKDGDRFTVGITSGATLSTFRFAYQYTTERPTG